MSSTTQNENILRRVIRSASAYVPQVPKPKKKITLTEKFAWTGIALLLYLVMGQIPLYGVTSDPKFDFLAFARVIFAAQQGTLMELGIGPIVTAGLLMQLLKGSDLIRLDFKNPDDRSLFTSATKIVTIIVIVAEGALYGVSVYGPLVAGPHIIGVVVAQLIGASVLVMLLDELVQKGWGVGSGLSLFIMAGIAQTILWSVFSPFPAQDGPTGILPFTIQSTIDGHGQDAFFRQGQLPSLFALGLTVGVILVLVYIEGIHVDIPIVSTKYRGFTAVYPIKLLYTSVIPVILSSALIANAVFMGQMMWANYNPNNANPAFNWIAQFDPSSQQTPTGGILYYITSPRSLDHVAADPVRAIIYVIFFTAIVTVFSRLWVELGGLSARTAAKNLLDADVQVPGFRRSENSVESLLNRYIPSLTIISGVIIGLLASLSDILNVFGSGTGILLMVNIMVSYYQTLVKEQVDTYMPKLAALLGRK
ncbi:preprotein translocase subunit SecY [Nitrososphaera viennensis]|uniref:Protein translocase subunit SecY n=2 Tax=Nitrososphaera viennensis TaxID=1034015 RepID=A0A060HJD1_9ARCH|nr:preprotein translocase subunit SecY [Nitrososphaera viennensis]AIC15628.1 preprotein translocase subunit SecY [Nitrososphaera viennensis EN76]UVS70503.1 preprotein translocase subunit SecY [Nitrososphaera viennensis]